jgi:hypothetical protein
MTRADLIEEVSRAAEMPRKEADIMIIAIFNTLSVPCDPATRLKSGDSAASGRGCAKLGQDAIRKPVSVSMSPRREFRISLPARK